MPTEVNAALTDDQTAAHRLAEYWKLRRKIFGDEKALLQMTLSGAMRDDNDDSTR
jgi:hypothetical protein